MTEPDSRSETTDLHSRPRIDPGTAEGRGRLLLMGGMGGFAIGTLADVAPVVWGGVCLIGVAFALQTAGKLVHYHDRPIPRSDEAKLAASWLLVAVTIGGLVANYAYARYGPGDGRYFYALAVAGIGFGLLHMAAQSAYLPNPEKSDKG